MRRSLCLIVLSAGLLLAGCDNSGPVKTSRTAEKKSVRFSGHEKQDVRDKLKRTAQILATIGPNHKAFSSIRKGLDLRRKEGYAEDISFAHLFEGKPEAKSKSLQSGYESVHTSFTTALTESLSKTSDSSSIKFNKELRSFLVDTGMTVAWMHRSNFDGLPDAPTITYHPLTKGSEDNDEATSIGFKPIDGERGKRYTRVEVDGEYLKNNSTLVLRPCEAGRVNGPNVNRYCEVSRKMVRVQPGDGSGGGGGTGGSDGNDDTPPNLTDDSRFSVHVEDLQCLEDQDGPFSGGPEWRILQAEPNITSPDFDNDDAVGGFISYEGFSGDECDNNDWEHVGTQWDGKWEKVDSENGVLIYDWDRWTSTSVNFNLGVSGEVAGVSINGSVESSFDLDNDQYFGNQPIARGLFVDHNWKDCNGNGTRDGRCIWGLGSAARITFGANEF